MKSLASHVRNLRRKGRGSSAPTCSRLRKARRSHQPHCTRILIDLFPAGFDRYHKLLRFGVPFYTKFLVRAFRNGYRLGRHVLGAFYIIHGDTLRALDAAGFWRSMPDLGSREVKLDDPLISMGPYIVGHKLIDLHEAW